MDWLSQSLVLAEVAVAMVLGGLIGVERQAANKPAGFRTHMLVAGAAALFVGLTDALLLHYQDFGDESLLRADPIRVLSAVIGGVSFLGAGTIFRHHHREQVEGLTTAASLLFSAGVGAAAGLRAWVLAVGATLLALFVLRALYSIENRLSRH